jgi:hypothetical protein
MVGFDQLLDGFELNSNHRDRGGECWGAGSQVNGEGYGYHFTKVVLMTVLGWFH